MRNDLKTLLKRLLDHEDIDICVTFDESQIAKLREVLKDVSPISHSNDG